MKNILFYGFIGKSVENLYGYYKNLRNIGPHGYFCKYTNNKNTHCDENLHLGQPLLDLSIPQKYKNFEGGPDVGITISNDLNNLEKYDYIYVFSLNNKLSNNLLNVDSKLNERIIIGVGILNKKILNKFKNWSHSPCYPATIYIPYPIHQTIYDNNPLNKIENNRDIDIFIYTKTNSIFKIYKNDLFNKEQIITKYFQSKNLVCKNLSYLYDIGHKKGGFLRSDLIEIAKKSKICLYLSYFDHGPLAISEITSMGCYVIGFFDKNFKGRGPNHSFPQSLFIDKITGEYINDFATILNNPDANNLIINGCNKIIDILNNRNFNNINIAKKSRDLYSIDNFANKLFTL